MLEGGITNIHDNLVLTMFARQHHSQSSSFLQALCCVVYREAASRSIKPRIFLCVCVSVMFEFGSSNRFNTVLVYGILLCVCASVALVMRLRYFSIDNANASLTHR